MYLIDTNVISELRKHKKANKGVVDFFKQIDINGEQCYISAITIGELRRGVELIRHRGDIAQAKKLEKWLENLINHYDDLILEFSTDSAQVWGHLRVPHYENAIDKQIAATALTYELIIVTRNTKDFRNTGARVLNPFS